MKTRIITPAELPKLFLIKSEENFNPWVSNRFTWTPDKIVRAWSKKWKYGKSLDGPWNEFKVVEYEPGDEIPVEVARKMSNEGKAVEFTEKKKQDWRWVDHLIKNADNGWVSFEYYKFRIAPAKVDYKPGDEIPVDVARKMFSEGKAVQCRMHGEWSEVASLFDLHSDVTILRGGWQFRIPPAAPEPEYIPLGREDVPPGSALRWINGNGSWSLIVNVDVGRGLVITSTGQYSFKDLTIGVEILRPGQDWQPCRKLKGK